MIPAGIGDLMLGVSVCFIRGIRGRQDATNKADPKRRRHSYNRFGSIHGVEEEDS